MRNKLCVFRRGQPLLQHIQEASAVLAKQRRGIQPQTWKHFGPKHPVARGWQPLKVRVSSNKPRDSLLAKKHYQIFFDARPFVIIALTM
jgi:hypothetical protein